MALWSASSVKAQTLVWNPNTESDLAGYIVYYGTAHNSYTTSIDVGNSTSWSLASLPAGPTYYFVVKAYNSARVLSAPSAEVTFNTPHTSGDVTSNAPDTSGDVTSNAPDTSGDVTSNAPDISAEPTLNVPATEMDAGGARTSLLWHNASTGELASWALEGTRQLSGGFLTPSTVSDSGWKVVATGDFNGDANRDIVWQHDDGTIAVWIMANDTLIDGRLFDPSTVGDPDWRIVAAGDLDRNGSADLIWRNRTTGALAGWLMNGTTRLDGRSLSPSTVSDLDWEIVGAADFDGDTQTDLLWRHRIDGSVSVWLMNELELRDGRSLSPGTVPDTGWSIRAVNDLNGDRQPDLIWQHADGRLSAWIMNGTTLARGIPLIPDAVSDTNWAIVGAR